MSDPDVRTGEPTAGRLPWLGGAPPPPGSERPRRFSRRGLLSGTGGLVVGAAGGVAGATLPDRPVPSVPDSPSGEHRGGEPVPAAGRHQAGIARPATPQPHALFAVHDLGDPGARVDLDSVFAALAAVGDRILEVTDAGRYDDTVTPDGPGDLVVSIGLGPRVLAAIDPGMPGATALPAFHDDENIPAVRRGGDLLVALHATDAAVLPTTLGTIETTVADVAPGLLRRRWAEHGFRAAGKDGIARNPLGYLDGITVPRTDEELTENVWISPDDHPRAAYGTVLVLRRLALDIARFAAEPQQRRDHVIGRHRVSGAPLSGGGRLDDVDLIAKAPEGHYRTPARSHARAAHPSFTGSRLMLRRPYAFTTPATANDPGQTGVLFISYQRDLDTFVRTQRRLDETDDLMTYTSPTASASFLVLPGHDVDRPLASALR